MAQDTEWTPVSHDTCDQVAGPFYHGTRADLAVGELLSAGFRSNYRDSVVMNHIYFTTIANAPDERFLSPWKELGPYLIRELLDGKRVVVHCKGGLGRAGTVASLLLLSTKTSSDAESAMLAVRTARPGAIETLEQECFVRKWAKALGQ